MDASDSRQKGGSGLGLAICRTIVLQHSGRIWAERNPVRGSTFRVFLPYHPSPVAPAGDGGDLRDRPRHGCAGRLPTPTRAPGSPRNSPATVTPSCEAATVEQTLSAAQQDAEAILLDTSLDGMNGWEILPLLRRMTQGRTRRSCCSAWRSEVRGSARGRRRLGCQAAARRRPAHRAGARALRPRRKGAYPHRRRRSSTWPVSSARSSPATTSPSRSRIPSRRRWTHVPLSSPTCWCWISACPTATASTWSTGSASTRTLPICRWSSTPAAKSRPSERRQLTLGPTHFLTKAHVQPQQLEALVLTMLRNSRKIEPAEVPAIGGTQSINRFRHRRRRQHRRRA